MLICSNGWPMVMIGSIQAVIILTLDEETCLWTRWGLGTLSLPQDISDYDDVRYCCSGADVCSECWPLMTVAIKVIDFALRDDFGFDHILWVYSGRRGVHCWVCDGKARRLNNEQRAAIADYFRVYKGNENSQKKVSLVGQALHPFLSRSYTEVLRSFFEDKLLCTQNLFLNEERYEKILEMIPNESITLELRGKWMENKRSEDDINTTRWGHLKHCLQSTSCSSVATYSTSEAWERIKWPIFGVVLH